MINKLITFEGIDGSGKSTQIQLLNKWFNSNEIKVNNIREPGGTNISEIIREILLNRNNEINSFAETLLFLASRTQLMDETISPMLAKGEFVICDRFIDSTVVYQGYGRGLDIDLINKINLIATQNILPCLTIYIAIDVDISVERRAVINNDRMEASGKSFLLNVKRGYDELRDLYPERIKIINGNDTIFNIQEKIQNLIKEQYKGLLC